MDKLFEMQNQEFKLQGRKFQVLSNFGICCGELRGLRVTSFGACVRSFCSVHGRWRRKILAKMSARPV